MVIALHICEYTKKYLNIPFTWTFMIYGFYINKTDKRK